MAKDRLGVISAFINPETVFDVNAFTLGARTVKPNIVVEVRHMGFWFDINDTPTYSYTHSNGSVRQYFREEYLAALMIDSGCEVIAHIGNTQRTVRLAGKLRGQGLARTDQQYYSFANDNQKGYLDGTGLPIPSCVGSIYENWQPLYRDLFEAVHRGTFNPMKSLDYDIDDTDNSPTGVSINPSGPGDSIAARKIVQDLARQEPSARQRPSWGPTPPTASAIVTATASPMPTRPSPPASLSKSPRPARCAGTSPASSKSRSFGSQVRRSRRSSRVVWSPARPSPAPASLTPPTTSSSSLRPQHRVSGQYVLSDSGPAAGSERKTSPRYAPHPRPMEAKRDALASGDDGDRAPAMSVASSKRSPSFRSRRGRRW